MKLLKEFFKSKTRFLTYFLLILVITLILGSKYFNQFAWHIQKNIGVRSFQGKNFDDADKKFRRLLALHQIKTPPGDNDWLANHFEPGESFWEYVRSNPAKPTKDKNVIYFSLLGDFNDAERKIIEETALYTQAFFNLKVKFTEPIKIEEVTDQARRINPYTHQEQLLTRFIIEKLMLKRIPSDSTAYFTFTKNDLWPGEGWNFVFGEASPEERIGVMSIYRYGDSQASEESRDLVLRRTIGTAVHELGHIFSIPHCIYFECMMNGSNSMEEADTRPFYLCPVCLRKLTWVLDVDPLKHYQGLLKVANELGLNEEAKFFQESIKLIQ